MLSRSERLVLRSELLNDPLSRGYAQLGTDTCVESLNTKNREVVLRISREQLLRWSAATAALKKLRLEVANGTNGKQAASEVALLMLSSGIEFLNLDAEIKGLVDLLVTGNVLSQSDRALLYERAKETVSRCEELLGLGVVCDNQDVYVALNELS